MTKSKKQKTLPVKPVTRTNAKPIDGDACTAEEHARDVAKIQAMATRQPPEPKVYRRGRKFSLNPFSRGKRAAKKQTIVPPAAIATNAVPNAERIANWNAVREQGLVTPAWKMGGNRKRPHSDKIMGLTRRSDYDPATNPDLTSCIRWTGPLTSDGYGHISGRAYAHRLSYEAFVGPISPGMLIMHACDNPACLNPLHLSQGSDATNMDDAAIKRRSSPHNRTPLSLVHRVYEMAATGVRYCDIARKLGMNKTTVRQLAVGITRKHDRADWLAARETEGKFA